jgi:UDP-glucose 4-epimerase
MTNKPTILLTGGAGYIGSHTFVNLLEAGFTPVILDDFSNSKPSVLKRLQRITGQPVKCHQGVAAKLNVQ